MNIKASFFVIISVVLSAFAGLNLQADPVVRLPLVSQSFKTNIDYFKAIGEAQKYPDHTVLIESQFSNAASSVQGSFDYFVIKDSGTNGGRILKMLPIQQYLDGGMLNPPTFTDVLTGETFTPELQTQDLRTGSNDFASTPEGLLENYYHYGSMKVGDQTLGVVVAYSDTLRYPTVSLSWGEDSALMNPGTIVDTFEQVVVDQIPTDTELAMMNSKGQAGLEDGLYLFVWTPKEFGHFKIESSLDFTKWQEKTLAPLVIYGDAVVYPTPQNSNGEFFRVIEL